MVVHTKVNKSEHSTFFSEQEHNRKTKRRERERKRERERERKRERERERERTCLPGSASLTICSMTRLIKMSSCKGKKKIKKFIMDIKISYPSTHTHLYQN